ncbi:MAG: hypothetical protein IJ335_11500 [Lachnospiraceae bacterium]|nr:hypothetical protein [Lachnospiraceae bacterium]
MKPKKNQFSYINIGAASLLVIFVILCLAIFATLSLSGAKSNYTFSEKMALHKSNYYNACNQATEILEEVDALLASTAKASQNAQDFYVEFTYALDREIKGIPIMIAIDHQVPILTWEIPLDDNQSLLVQLKVQWPYQNDTTEPGYHYSITKWQTISNTN